MALSAVSWTATASSLNSTLARPASMIVARFVGGGNFIFTTTPEPACLRLVRALAVETHENWIEAMQYLNMEPLREQKKGSVTKAGRCGLMVFLQC
jgi:hypothetical protein